MKAKKRLGQNFLTDLGVVEEMIKAAAVSADDAVLEIGPGTGVLTAALVDTGASVYALEYDRDLIPMLTEKFGGHSNISITEADIRTLYIAQFLREQDVDSYKVIANIPYYITSLIIRLFLESEVQPSQMMLMVQKEVAERICAKPGEMSLLALSVQYFGNPSIVREVPRTSFDPAPEVDSAVLHISGIRRPHNKHKEKDFFRIVRVGFSAKRKKLISNLTNGLHCNKEELDKAFNALGIPPSARAQELSLDQWHKLREMICD